MNSRERIEAQMNFAPVDHIPTLGGWLTSAKQYQHFAGISSEEFWKDPEMGAILAYKNLQLDGLISIFIPPDEYGYTHATKEGLKEKKTAYPTPESVIDYVDSLPSVDSLSGTFEAKTFYEEITNEMRAKQEKMGDMVWMPARWACGGSFMWYGTFGYESYFMALALYPDKMRKLFAYSTEEARLQNEVLGRVYEDNNFCKLLLMGQDICGQTGPMVSLKFLEEVYFPLAKMAVKPLLEAGFKLIWHSDGNIMPIVDLVLDIGVAGFQGFQWEAGVSLEELAKRRTKMGGKLIFFTGMNITRTLPLGTVDEVKREIDECVAITQGKGLFVLSSNTVNPDAKLENIQTAYQYPHSISTR